MSWGHNRVTLLGRLTRDVLVREDADYTACAFTLAINRAYTDSSGEAKEETTFVRCEAWGRLAGAIARYHAKGDPIFVEGRLRLDQWMADDGSSRQMIKVVVTRAVFIAPRRDGITGTPTSEGNAPG